MSFVTYILYSQDRDRYYVGQTADLVERAAGHIAGKTQATRDASDWQLVFVEAAATLQAAMALERRIKKTKSRKSIGRYIRDARNLVPTPISLRDIVSGRSAAW